MTNIHALGVVLTTLCAIVLFIWVVISHPLPVIAFSLVIIALEMILGTRGR